MFSEFYEYNIYKSSSLRLIHGLRNYLSYICLTIHICLLCKAIIILLLITIAQRKFLNNEVKSLCLIKTNTFFTVILQLNILRYFNIKNITFLLK